MAAPASYSRTISNYDYSALQREVESLKKERDAYRDENNQLREKARWLEGCIVEAEKNVRILEGDLLIANSKETNNTQCGVVATDSKNELQSEETKSQQYGSTERNEEHMQLSRYDLQKLAEFHDPTRREVKELGEKITNLQAALHGVKMQSESGGKSWSLFSYPFSCGNCTILKKKLDELKVENSSLVSQQNAEIKISQGDFSESKDTIAKHYKTFFNQEGDRLATRNKTQPQGRCELRIIFQRVHKAVQEKVMMQVQSTIPRLFQPATEQMPLKDLSRAFARLLASQNLTGLCPEEWKQKFVEDESRYGTSPELIAEAIALSWKLATAVPPMIPSTEHPTFDEAIHEQISDHGHIRKRNQLHKGLHKGDTVRYIQPILFGSCTCDVSVNGQVQAATTDT